MRCALFATVLSVLLLAGCITTATTSPTPSPWDTSYRALDINASSQVVGCVDLSQVIQVQSQQYTFRNMRALTWTAQGGGTDLGSLATGSGSLGDPVTRYSVANGINKWGHVVGRSSLNRSEAHAFLLTSTGGMTDLGTLGGETSGANAVSDAGHVVGESLTDAEEAHAFLWTAESGMIDLGTLGGDRSIATDVNSHGQVVGYSKTAAGETHAFLWTAESGMVDLGTLGGPASNANAINDQGQVVGFAQLEDGLLHPALWQSDGSLTDLGAESGLMIGGLAADINENGDVVGSRLAITGGELTLKVGDTVPTHERAFLWTATGGPVNLGTLGGATSTAAAINDLGQVVGFSETATGESHAFLWTADAGMTDLGIWAGAAG